MADHTVNPDGVELDESSPSRANDDRLDQIEKRLQQLTNKGEVDESQQQPDFGPPRVRTNTIIHSYHRHK